MLAALILGLLSLSCATRRPPTGPPFYLPSQDMLLTKVPDDCMVAYYINAPRGRDSIAVFYCHGTTDQLREWWQ